MHPPYKSAGYSTVSPYLIVDGAQRTIQFLVTVFDAVELRRFTDDQGQLLHAEVRLDDSVLMLADSADGWPSVPAHVHLYVADVDAAYQRALAAGATSVQAPLQRDDEDLRGGVKDASGITWWLATRVGAPEHLLARLPSGLGKPAEGALAHAGFTRLAQLTTVSERELRQLHGVGPKAIARLQTVLAAHGLSFRSA